MDAIAQHELAPCERVQAALSQCAELIAALALVEPVVGLGGLGTELEAMVAHHLEGSGVSQRAASALFGVTRRTYQRLRVPRAKTAGCRSLHERVLDALAPAPLSEVALVMQLQPIEEEIVRAVVRDLVRRGRIVREGRGRAGVLRCAR